MVYREGGAGSDQGLSLFGAVIYAPQQRINPFPYFASAGASYRGLVPGRDKDTAGFALYYGGFSRHLPGQTYELVLEWTYAIAVARWLTVQPDLQYVINPGGRSSVGNAVVVGAQLAVEL
jgi:porin